MGQEDYRELASFLERFIRRFKMLKGAEGLCLTGICFLILVSLGFAIREIKGLFPYMPLVYSLLSAFLLVALGSWTFFRWGQRVSQEWAARYIEKKCPGLRNNLINSLQLYPQVAGEKPSQGISGSMVLALLRATRKQLQALRAEDFIPTERIRTEFRLLGMLFLPIFAAVLFNPSSVKDTFSLLAHPLKDLPPSQTSIDVRPKGVRLLRGSPVTIEATASGALPKSMELYLWYGRQGEHETIAMEDRGRGKFAARIPNVQKNLQYSAVAGSFSSPRFAIEAVDAPVVGNIKITLYPPNYTGLQTQNIEGGNVEGIKGSTIRLEASSSKEIAKARMVLDGGKEVPLKIEGKKLQGNLVLFQSEKYRIEV